MAQNHKYVNQKSTWRFFFFFLKQQILGSLYLGVYMGWGSSGHSYMFKSSLTYSRVSRNVNHTMERIPKVKVFPTCACTVDHGTLQADPPRWKGMSPTSLTPTHVLTPLYNQQEKCKFMQLVKKKNQIHSYTIIMLWFVYFRITLTISYVA